MEEKEVVLLLDRFGYGKVLEKAIYERNREVADRENRIVLPCMNTDKLCIFTQTGLMHQMKVQDIPAGRLRDKGVPLDNVANYDSRTEQILRIIPASELPECKLLFVTAGAMVKLVREANPEIPCAIGFGISTPEQAKKMAQHADGVIVGSAIVRQIGELGEEAEKAVSGYVSEMKAAIII